MSINIPEEKNATPIAIIAKSQIFLALRPAYRAIKDTVITKIIKVPKSGIARKITNINALITPNLIRKERSSISSFFLNNRCDIKRIYANFNTSAGWMLGIPGIQKSIHPAEIPFFT